MVVQRTNRFIEVPKDFGPARVRTEKMRAHNGPNQSPVWIQCGAVNLTGGTEQTNRLAGRSVAIKANNVFAE